MPGRGCGTQPAAPGSGTSLMQLRPAPPGVAAGQRRRPGRARPRGSRWSGAGTQSPEAKRDRGAAAPARLSSALGARRGSPRLPAGPGRSQGIPGAWHKDQGCPAPRLHIPLPSRRVAAGVGSVQSTKSSEYTLRCTPTSATSSALLLRPSQPCPGVLRAGQDGSGPMAPGPRQSRVKICWLCYSLWCDFSQSITSHFPLRLPVLYSFR